jgi:hypothetical protein
MHDILHPEYLKWKTQWSKYRLTYEAGDKFKRQYLVQFSERESHKDFKDRSDITYVPAFAKAAVNEVKNAVFQRMADIARTGGSVSYQRAINGKDGGVDNLGATMNSFIGRHVLPELLFMGRVGIYVDMPSDIGNNFVDQQDIHPYLYTYKAEDIRSWSYDFRGNLTAVLLTNNIWAVDEETKLPNGDIETQYIYLFIEDGEVWASFYNDDGELTDSLLLDGLKRIPFVFIDIGESLLKDVADYQIAMMNMASADLGYALKSNFPFYVEQFDEQAESAYSQRGEYDADEEFDPDGNDREGEQKDSKIELGTGAGRRYPKSVKNAPEFIHPSPEPLEISIKKQEILKEEIRLLVNLAVSNLKGASNISAEAKKQDQSGLESGLSFIGLTLEQAEREITNLWSQYESSEPATIKYPEKYSLRSEEDRRKSAESMVDMMIKVPSITYKRELAKRVSEQMLGPRTSFEDLQKVYDEIDKAPFFEPEIDNIHRDAELGLVSKDFASESRGYPAGEAVKAGAEHVERAKAIALAQSEASNSAARGVTDLAVSPTEEAKLEKESSQDRDKVVEGSPVRGGGR